MEPAAPIFYDEITACQLPAPLVTMPTLETPRYLTGILLQGNYQKFSRAICPNRVIGE